jgi:hypothetical protein
MLDWLWIAGLLLPFGWWAGSRGVLGAGTVGVLGVMLIVPAWTQAIATPPAQLAAAVVGVVAGRALALAVSRASGRRAIWVS